jgi:membrane associated rhomboid family serine protease
MYVPPDPAHCPGLNERTLPVIIIPLSGRLSIKNPPALTLALITVNCIVFFAFHPSDVKLADQADDYYVESGLALTEVLAYEQYQEYGAVVRLSEADVRKGACALSELYPRVAGMHRDRGFMARLGKGQVITPALEIFPRWKYERARFDGLMGRTSAMRYGFRPALWSLGGMFTYMFLHAGFFHLLGNMLFLWLAGCVVELAWGRLAMIVIYLAGGLCSAALFGLAYHASAEPLVGASGAVAALMGAYAILYGRREIKVFYSLGFFFDYTMVPGFVILVLWLGNELFQLLVDKAGSVAYAAHIGGFSSGALMGLLCRRHLGGEGVPRPAEADGVPQLLDGALRKVETLDVQGARAAFVQVLEKDPENRAALTQMFHLDKLSPASVEFHDSARKLIVHLLKDRHAHREVAGVYREYLERSGGHKLPRSVVFSLISYLASTGHVVDAEDIVGGLLKRAPDLPKIPECLLFLARACIRDGFRDKARSYLQVILIRYPDSRECVAARRILEDQEA